MAAGVDPLEVARMSFAQGAMRKHFLHLLESSQISVFPKAAEPQSRVQAAVTWFALLDDDRKGPFSTEAEAKAAVESDLQGAFSLSARGRVSRPSSKKVWSLFNGAAPSQPPQQPKKGNALDSKRFRLASETAKQKTSRGKKASTKT